MSYDPRTIAFVMMVLGEGLLMRGASPGKIVMGLRVTGTGGEAMDINRAAIRNLSKVVSVVPLFAGVIMALWSKRRQMLHDQFAGAYVHDAK